MAKLSARRARRLRRYIWENRCPERPGLTHDWEWTAVFDPMSYGSVIEFHVCAKCGEDDY